MRRLRARSVPAAALCLVLSSARLAHAQQVELPRADGHMLSLGDALDAARRNVPSVLAAIGQARSAEGQVMFARTAMQPVISGSVSLSATASNSNTLYSPAGMGTTAGMCLMVTSSGTCTSANGGVFASAYLDATITARWTLYDFGRTALNVDAAQRSQRSLEASVRGAERTAIAAAATAYFAVLADQELVAAAQETLRQRQRELEISVGRVRAGVDPVINQTRAEIAAATAQLDLSTAQANVANDTAALAGALGFDPARPPTVARPTEVAFDDDPQHAADAALASRPEVLAAQLHVASSEASVAAARALWRPSINASGSAGARLSVTSTPLATLLETGTVLLSLAVPIYDPTIPANVRIAEGNLIVARADLMQQVLTVRTDAVQSALAVRAAREQLDEAQHNAELAAANLALSEGRYAAGATTILELVDAEAQDATARLTVVQRRFQFESAKVRLLGAVNRLSDLVGHAPAATAPVR